MKNLENVSKTLFDLLASKDFAVTILDTAGKPVDSPDQARIFNFDYTSNSKDYGSVVILISPDNSVDVFCGDSFGQHMNSDVKSNWYEFLYQVRMFAKRHLFSFSVKDMTKLKYTMKDIAAASKEDPLAEGWTGTKRRSESSGPGNTTKLIIIHDKNIDETVDKRYRNIDKLYIQNESGERFLVPSKRLAAGRMLARHCAEGGNPYDERGKHIVNIADDLAKLGKFARTVKRRTLPADSQPLVEKALEHYTKLRREAKSLVTRRGYQNYFNNWSADSNLNPDVEPLKELFTSKSIDTFVEDCLPILAKLSEQGKDMSYSDQYASWANQLVEGTWALPDTPEKIERLKELLSSELIVGVDAQNATGALYDLVGDDSLFDLLGDIADEDPNADVSGSVKDWIKNNMSQTWSKLGISDEEYDAGVDDYFDNEEGVKEAAGDTQNYAIAQKTESYITLDRFEYATAEDAYRELAGWDRRDAKAHVVINRDGDNVDPQGNTALGYTYNVEGNDKSVPADGGPGEWPKGKQHYRNDPEWEPAEYNEPDLEEGSEDGYGDHNERFYSNPRNRQELADRMRKEKWEREAERSRGDREEEFAEGIDGEQLDEIESPMPNAVELVKMMRQAISGEADRQSVFTWLQNLREKYGHEYAMTVYHAAQKIVNHKPQTVGEDSVYGSEQMDDYDDKYDTDRQEPKYLYGNEEVIAQITQLVNAGEHVESGIVGAMGKVEEVGSDGRVTITIRGGKRGRGTFNLKSIKEPITMDQVNGAYRFTNYSQPSDDKYAIGEASAKPLTPAKLIKNAYENGDLIGCDQISKSTKDGEGVFIFRRGFFYSHGGTAEKFAAKVDSMLTAAGIDHEMLDQGEHWAPFKGGAGIKASTHWWAKVRVNGQATPQGEQQPVTEYDAGEDFGRNEAYDHPDYMNWKKHAYRKGATHVRPLGRNELVAKDHRGVTISKFNANDGFAVQEDQLNEMSTALDAVMIGGIRFELDQWPDKSRSIASSKLDGMITGAAEKVSALWQKIKAIPKDTPVQKIVSAWNTLNEKWHSMRTAESLGEAKEKSGKVEAYGVKGMKSTQWRKTFPSQEAFEKWVEKQDGNVEVQGTRQVDESWDPEGLVSDGSGKNTPKVKPLGKGKPTLTGKAADEQLAKWKEEDDAELAKQGKSSMTREAKEEDEDDEFDVSYDRATPRSNRPHNDPGKRYTGKSKPPVCEACNEAPCCCATNESLEQIKFLAGRK